MRLGLIGLGRIGAFHADTLSHLDEVDSLVVTDAVPAVTASVAERFGAEAAESPEALISSGVDGIVIAAATDAHTALIRAGVDAGIPVFCEKPLSGVVDEAIAIADHVNASGVPVQIGYPRRFDPAYLAARDALAGGELGWLHTLRSTTLDPAPAPRGYIAVSGGIFRDCSVHDFDTVRWGCRVQCGRAHGVNPAELAVGHRGAGREVGRVEPAGVADLDGHPAAVDVVGDGDGVGDDPGERLLAEHRDAGVDAGRDQLEVRVGGRGDHDPVDAGLGQRLG